MSLNRFMKIKCLTLFDITKTDANPRRRSIEIEDSTLWEKKCSQQSNFETILQIISLRCQPEDITTPHIEKIKLDKKCGWGTKYIGSKNTANQWIFTFTIAQKAALRNGDNEIGSLILDSEGVPLIRGLDEWSGVNDSLTHTPNYKNIQFEIEEL